MHLDFLKNYSQTIPQLSRWIYDEWKNYDKSLTLEKLILSFNERLNDTLLPMTFVVLKNDQPIGCVSLKTESGTEFKDFPQNSVWIGSLQVISEERSQGIGKELLKFCTLVAKKSFNNEELYFYTSNPVNVAWYVKNGAEIIEKRPFRGHTITLMKIVN